MSEQSRPLKGRKVNTGSKIFTVRLNTVKDF